MNGSLRVLAAGILVALLAPLAGANGPRPAFPDNKGDGKVIPENMGKVMVKKKAQYATVFDPKATRTKLVIPKKLVTAAGAAPEKEVKDAPEQSAAASGHTIMTGTALSMGLITGGLWWMRRGKEGLGRGKTALLLVVGLLSFGVLGASTLFADLAFPGKDKGKGFPGPIGGPGVGFGPFNVQKQEVDIEVTEKGDTIYLVVPGANFGNPFGPGGFGPGFPGPGGFGPGGAIGPGGPAGPGGLIPPGGGPVGPGGLAPPGGGLFPGGQKDAPGLFPGGQKDAPKKDNPPAKDNPFPKDNPFR